MPKTTVTPRTLKLILIILAGLTVIIFTLFQLRFYLGGAHIAIDSTYFESNNPWVDLVFQVTNTKELTVQGVGVIPQVNGLVQKRIYLASGLNTILIQAQDPYGKTTSEKIHVLYPQEGIIPD